MAERFEQWQLLRTKLDAAVEDDDWVGTNTPPADNFFAPMPSGKTYDGRAYTGIEVRVVGCTAARVPVNRSTNTCDITCIDRVRRDRPPLGGTVGDAAVLGDTGPDEDVPLQTRTRFPLNGSSEFTIRISSNTGIAGVNRLQIWWRAVSE